MQLGISVTGHNMANAATEGYSRQRVVLQNDKQYDGTHVLGMGARVEEIQRIHDVLIDRRIQNQKSDHSMLTAEKDVLDLMEASLGQVLDRQSLSAEGTAASRGVGASGGLSELLDEFFGTLSALTADPSSTALRQQLMNVSESLAVRFRTNDAAIRELQSSVEEEAALEAANANELIAQISRLNREIASDETKASGKSNDLRDRRQQNIEQLAEIASLETINNDDGTVTVTIGGVVVTGVPEPADTLESYVTPEGTLGFRTVTGQQDIVISSGRLGGLAHARDVSLEGLRTDLDSFAVRFMNSVNDIHRSGFDLQGNTGKDFFTGTSAADIAVNAELLDNPSGFQGSADGTSGNNDVIHQLFDLSKTRNPEMQNQNFVDGYADIIGRFGQRIQGLNTAIGDNQAIGEMLTEKRNSVSGVSLDEEMTSLIQFQRAYQASARVINTLDEMLQTAISIGV
jgi:flagellar hook-associated protein 1 FlgK